MIKIFYIVVFILVSLVFMKNAMHMFQQNRYELKRYTKWLFSFKPFLIKYVITYICLMIVSLFLSGYSSHLFVVIVTLLFSFIFIKYESEISYVKPLVYTSRVKRTFVIYYIFLILSIIDLLEININKVGIVGIISVVIPYILIYIVAIILMPIEYAIKKKYENEARNILASQNDLIKVGITGSYGKTTTKNIIGELLFNNFYTLITPASYNTPMGITRTIRENLKKFHQVFICEMGADHVGDIGYLMKMVKPKYGIVSSIGPQHLNTFGNINNIVREKMRAIEMLPENGVGIINIDNEYISSYNIKNVCKILTVGINNEADYQAKNIKYSKDGTKFDVTIKDKKYHFKTKLLGKHNICNILLGIALADELGIDPKMIVQSVNDLSQIEHRLELKEINGLSFIDDAFNSNPVGSKYALESLKLMPGRRIVVTPGLIDLGELENRYNYEFGKYMYGNCDYVVLVGKNKTKYIYKGLNDSGFEMNNVKVVEQIYDAFNYIYTNFTSTDTILLENDLPDAFNK